MPHIKATPIGLNGIISTGSGMYQRINTALERQEIPIDEITVVANEETVTVYVGGTTFKLPVDEWRIFKNRVNKAVREAKKMSNTDRYYDKIESLLKELDEMTDRLPKIFFFEHKEQVARIINASDRVNMKLKALMYRYFSALAAIKEGEQNENLKSN